MRGFQRKDSLAHHPGRPKVGHRQVEGKLRLIERGSRFLSGADGWERTKPAHEIFQRGKGDAHPLWAAAAAGGEQPIGIPGRVAAPLAGRKKAAGRAGRQAGFPASPLPSLVALSRSAPPHRHRPAAARPAERQHSTAGNRLNYLPRSDRQGALQGEKRFVESFPAASSSLAFYSRLNLIGGD